MARLNLDAIPDKPLRKMKELLALLEPDDRDAVIAAAMGNKNIPEVRAAVQEAYPELPAFELKTWVNWANNLRMGRTVG